MGTIQEELKEKVLAGELAINNAVAYKMHKNCTTPMWAIKGKVAHAERLRQKGIAWDEQAKAIGVHPTTLYMWRRQLKQFTPRQANHYNKGKKMPVAAIPVQYSKPTKTPDFIARYTVDEVLDYTGITWTREQRLEVELGLLKNVVRRFESRA
jgi:hypothetical protein